MREIHAALRGQKQTSANTLPISLVTNKDHHCKSTANSKPSQKNPYNLYEWYEIRTKYTNF